MITQLKRIYKKEQFNPSALGVLINPFYFARKYLHQSIRRHSDYLTGKMIDLGSGSKPYKELFHVSEYIGVEIGDTRDHGNKHVDYFYDGKTLPFADGTFDSAFSSQVFEHIFNLEEILRELNRVMKPDGNILVTLPFAWPEHEQPYDFARYTSFGIKNLFERNGFEIIKMEKTGNYPTTLCQLLAAYISEHMPNKIPIARLFLTIFIIGPINLVGIIFSLSTRTNDSYYLDNVVLAKKRLL